MKIISISGSGRTGSTLLSVLLTQNNEVFNLGQTRDLWSAYGQNAPCSCGQTLTQCEHWTPVLDDVFGKDTAIGLAKMNRLMQAFRNDANAMADWTDSQSMELLRDDHQEFLELMTRFVRRVGEQSGAEALLDASKSPEIALAFSLLEDIDSFVINLVRDPRAVACSWERKKDRKVAIDYSLAWAQRQIRLVRWSQALGDRFCAVRYEDFSAAPKTISSRLLSWAGLEPVEQIFTTDNQAEINWYSQHLYPPANETFLAEKKSRIEIATANSWRDPANTSLHQAVEKVVGEVMEKFGYRRGVTDASSVARGAPKNTPKVVGASAMGVSSGPIVDSHRYVFLICSERSGSNLISVMLGNHSQVVAPPPYHLCRDVGLNLHTALDGGLQSTAWSKMRELMTTRVRQLKNAKQAEEFGDWINAREQLDFAELARTMFLDLEGADSDSFVFVKENNLHKSLFFLLHYFPEAKFVFQVRDPRDYLLSALNRKEGELGNKFGSNHRALEIWRDDQLGGLNALAHLGPERVFVQRYEDLVSAPEQVLPGLCAFFGIQYQENMLDFHASDAAGSLAQPGGPRENLNKPLMSNNFGK